MGSAFPAVLEMNWDGSGLDTSDQGMGSPAHNSDVDDERELQKGQTFPISGVKVNESSLGDEPTDTPNPLCRRPLLRPPPSAWLWADPGVI